MSNKPTPDMSSADIIKALDGMSIKDQASWLTDNYTKVNPDDLGKIVAWASSKVQSSGLASPDAADLPKLSNILVKADHYQKINTDPVRLAAAADKAVAAAVAGDKSPMDVDGSGVPNDRTTAAIEAAKVKYTAAAQAANPTTNPDVIAQTVDAAAVKTGQKSSFATPTWLLTYMDGKPGFSGDITSTQKDRVVADWNETYGTDLSWIQLVKSPQFNDPTNETTQVVQGAILDLKPAITYNVALPNGKSVALTSDQNTPGFINGRPIADVVKAVKYASSFGLTNDNGDVGWQPLNALMKANGSLMPVDERYAALKHRVDLMSDPAFVLPYAPSNRTNPKFTGELDNHKELLANAKREMADYEKAHPEVLQEGSADSILKLGPLDIKVPGLAVSKTIQAYKDGLTKYGDPTMAYVSALNPALAARLYASGGDITKVDQNDVTAAMTLLNKGGWNYTQMAQQGFSAGLGIQDFLDNMDAKNKEIARKKLADQGPVQNFTDPEAVKQTVRSLWNTMFRQDPSPAMEEQFAKEIHTMEANATLADASKGINGQNVDVGSQIQKILQDSPMYKQLYGNKGNMTDEAYQAQFVNAEQSVLGGQMDNQSILTGMGQGQYATTVGAAGVTGLATNNSTFLGNLANAAQVMNNMT